MVYSGTPLPPACFSSSNPTRAPPLHGVPKDPPLSCTCSSSCQPARATPAQRSMPAIHACQDFGPPAGGHHLRVAQNPQPTLTLAPDIPPGQLSAELKGTPAQACHSSNQPAKATRHTVYTGHSYTRSTASRSCFS